MSDKTSRQRPSTPATRYEAVREPPQRDGYPQRIELWKLFKGRESLNRGELFRLVQLANDDQRFRPNGGPVDEAYCRIELTDMTKRGYLRRISG